MTAAATPVFTPKPQGWYPDLKPAQPLPKSAAWIAVAGLVPRPPPPTRQPVPGPAVAGVQPFLNEAAPWIAEVARATPPGLFTRWPQPLPALAASGLQPLSEIGFIADQGQPMADTIVIATAVPRPPSDAIVAMQPRALAAWMATAADLALRTWPQAFTPLGIAPQPIFDLAAFIADELQTTALAASLRRWPQPSPNFAVAVQPFALPRAAWIAIASILATPGLVTSSATPRTLVVATSSADAVIDVRGVPRSLVVATSSVRTVIDANGIPRTIIVIDARRVN